CPGGGHPVGSARILAACRRLLATIFVTARIARGGALEIPIASLRLKRLSIFLCLNLNEPPCPFLENQLFFFCKIRIRIRRRHKVSIALEKSRRYGSKCNIPFQAFEYGLIRQLRILDELTVVRSLLRYPALQFHQQALIFNQDCSNLSCRGRHTAQVFLAQVGSLFDPVFISPLFANLALRVGLPLGQSWRAKPERKANN